MDGWQPPEAAASTWTPPEVKNKPQPWAGPPEAQTVTSSGSRPPAFHDITKEADTPASTLGQRAAAPVQAAQQGFNELRPHPLEYMDHATKDFGEGYEQAKGAVTAPWKHWYDPGKGLFNFVMGGGQAALSPATAGYNTAVGDPVQRTAQTVGQPEAGERANLLLSLVGPGGVAKEAGAARGAEGIAKLPEKPHTSIASPKPEAVGVPVQLDEIKVNGKPFTPPEAKDMPQPARAGGAAATPLGDILQQNRRDAEMPKGPALQRAQQHVDNASKFVRGIFAPETISAEARGAASDIRQAQGAGTRRSEQASAAMEDVRKHAEGLSEQEHLDLIDHMENYTGRNGYLPPSLKHLEPAAPLIDTLRQEFQSQRKELESLPGADKMGFVEDYISHYWKNPEVFREAEDTRAAPTTGFGSASKEGSSGFTKARKIPTYAEGIRMGGIPKYTNPVEIATRSIENSNRYIESARMIDKWKEQGVMKAFSQGEQPEGWAKLEGGAAGYRGVALGKDMYAPADVAKVYNQFTSNKWRDEAGSIISRLQMAANMVTGLTLAGPTYHAMLTVGEAVATDMSRGVMKLGYGDLSGLKDIAKSAGAPVRGALRGNELKKAYLARHTLEKADPKLQRIVELAEAANFRVVGQGRIADEYRYTRAKSLFDGLTRDTFIPGAAKATYETIRHNPWRLPGRMLATVSEPLFKHYIPAIKNGAFREALGDWLSRNPQASVQEQVEYATHMADHIDNIFGEMNRDNVLWNNRLKQLASLVQTSFSYELGTARNVMGSAVDTANTMQRIRSGGPALTEKQAYMLALGATYFIANATYTGLKEGIAAAEGKDFAGGYGLQPRDLLFGRTGGRDPKGNPERVRLPSTFKDPIGFVEDPIGEFTNKGSPFLTKIKELATQKTFGDVPMARHGPNVPFTTTLGDYLRYGMKQGPIAFENQMRVERGSNISRGERLMGLGQAAQKFSSPDRERKYEHDQLKNDNRRYRKALAKERNKYQ